MADTLRRLKEEIRSCKANNDIIIQEEEKLAEVNAVGLVIFAVARDQFGSAMIKRKKLMGHMVVGHMMVIAQIKMT